jgi:3-oxoacyl-[acyl-carrier protein] reductase
VWPGVGVRLPSGIIRSAAHSYQEDFWCGQDYYVEVWIEKDALLGVVEQPCQEYRVPYFACRGNNSQSEQYKAGRRFDKCRASGKKPIVLHLGDHDPNGLDMTRDNTDRLRMFAREPIEVRRKRRHVPRSGQLHESLEVPMIEAKSAVVKKGDDMDLGITGRNALVCGSSKGLGKGCAFALAREGVNLVITARGSEALEATAAEIRNATGVSVRIVACDITTPEGRDAALQVLPDPDILVTNAGGPPPGDYRDWRRESWISALDANMIAPIELIRLTIESMIDRKFGRVVNITSSAVKAPIAFLGLSNGARTGLTGFVAGLARQVIKHNVTINNLLPGYHATDRLGAAADAVAKQTGKNIEEAQQAILDQIPAGRFGSPEEFGAACAFLCSAASGFIAGQNLLLDGAAYPGTFG